MVIRGEEPWFSDIVTTLQATTLQKVSPIKKRRSYFPSYNIIFGTSHTFFEVALMGLLEDVFLGKKQGTFYSVFIMDPLEDIMENITWERKFLMRNSNGRRYLRMQPHLLRSVTHVKDQTTSLHAMNCRKTSFKFARCLIFGESILGDLFQLHEVTSIS